ncbi:TetR/AcrR family transcriptional regulator [Streptomyces sp. NRRL B-24484]|uniref:TetR/AcrR family transcriptional regulator n=1 Tax=Streptomyces sp. NRRL B-24484 TaxID=1463833 RepID=UPI0006940934|nr:TetR/AcrR family transcriptional regulator [Streptomyces sp. NRRL B-24484]
MRRSEGRSASTPAAPADELWPDVQPETARRLMAAGLECFARQGYHATTTRDISAAAGMSSAALYVHFPSKAALLFEIVRSGHEQILAVVDRAVTGAGDPVVRMGRLAREFTEWHARRHAVARVVAYELKSLPEDDYRTVVDLRRRIEHLTQGLVREGIEAGVFEVRDVQAAGRAVLSLGIDVARWYEDRMRTSPRALGQQYADLVLRMLGADPA